MTREWQRFIESLDGGGRDWVNSLDVRALASLQGDERARAIDLLLSRLGANDARVSRALGGLDDPRVRPALEAHLAQATGQDRVATAAALLQQIGPQDRDARDDSATVATTAVRAIEAGLLDPSLNVATEALDAALLAGKAVVPALLGAAVRHPSDNVRVGAIKRALYLTGVNPSPGSWDHRTEIVALTDLEPVARRQAFASLCKRMGVDLQTYRGPRP